MCLITFMGYELTWLKSKEIFFTKFHTLALEVSASVSLPVASPVQYCQLNFLSGKCLRCLSFHHFYTILLLFPSKNHNVNS